MPPLVAGLIGALSVLVLVGLVIFGYVGVRRRQALIELEKGPQVPAMAVDVVDEIPSGVVIIGPHDDLLAHNQVALDIGAVRGSRIGFQELLDVVRRVRQTGERFDGEVSRETIPGGDPLQLRCRISPLEDGVVLIAAFDDTQSKRVEAVRRDFVANVSHELKTPIGAIGVLTEAVLAAKDDPEAVERFGNRLHSESDRLAQLVKQVIELSRLQSSDPLLERQTLELPGLVDEAIGRCRERAEQRRVRILVAQTTATPVMGDRGQIVEAITNLVENAINYSGEGARVAISIVDVDEDDESFVDLKVSDNGIGIKPEDQDRIFERFYRVDYGRSRSSGGTGLGLSIVRHIALAHGGNIRVWSNPGQGSTFTLRLPGHHSVTHQLRKEDR